MTSAPTLHQPADVADADRADDAANFADGPPLRTAHDEQLIRARLAPLRRPGRWAAAAVLAVVVAMAAHALLTNPHFEWDVVGDYFFSPDILNGLILTLWLTGAVMVSGYLLGIGLATMRLSGNPVLQSVSFGFVWLVRSVPPLVQLLFWYELASLFPQLSIGIPFGPQFVHFDTAHLLGGVLAAYVALTLDVAAFASEIVRGGLLSVDHGQVEAANAVGLSPVRTFRRIVLPQAMPAIVPASGNMLIGMLKATSLVSVIAVTDLLHSVQLIYSENFLIIPLLLVATVWYIILTTLLSIGQYFVERHYARGRGRAERGRFWSVARGNLRPRFGLRGGAA